MRLSALFYYSAVIFILFTSCNSTSTVVNSKKKPSRPIEKSIVYAVAQRYETRMMWEKELAYRLSIRGFNVITSVGIDTTHKKPYTVDELRAIIKNHGLDGIITMKFKDLKKKGAYSASDRYISEPEGQRYWFNYLNPNMNVYQWTYETQQTVTIESNIYDTDTEEIVFHTETSATNAGSDEALAGDITESLANAIKRSNLLVRTKEKE